VQQSLVLLAILLSSACATKENSQPQIYYGPFSESQNVELFYTENELIKVRMNAPVVFEQQNGDREFPDGIHLEFYDENGRLTSTLRANYAFYDKKEDRWKGQGKVEVKNIEKNEQLNTEELYWKPPEKRIFTESFVTIRLATEVIYGTGLEAAEDFSSYNVKHPQGEFEVAE
jgi:lipopolysaccharide export system protein LptC